MKCSLLFELRRAKGIPLGCNVESVSLKKEEEGIEASVELLRRVAQMPAATVAPPDRA